MHTRVQTALFLTIALISAVFISTAGAAVLQCKQCKMLLDPANRRFSVSLSGGAEYFDDIGCAVTWRAGVSDAAKAAFDRTARVYDFGTGEPLAVTQAFFLQHAGFRTPMGFDIIAFRSKDSAEKTRREKGAGEVLTYNQLCAGVRNPAH